MQIHLLFSLKMVLDEKVVIINENCCNLWICLVLPKGHKTVIIVSSWLLTQIWVKGVHYFYTKIGYLTVSLKNLKNQKKSGMKNDFFNKKAMDLLFVVNILTLMPNLWELQSLKFGNGVDLWQDLHFTVGCD